METVIGINGACGRMGQRLVALAWKDPELTLAAALESPDHPAMGSDAGEIAGVGKIDILVQDALAPDQSLNVLIDFSQPEGTMAVLPVCVARGIPLVVATTGHNATQRQEIEAAAHRTAILVAPNMSLAVNLLMKLVGRAAQTLGGQDYDVEIVERHHRYKKDAPSGTALAFARIVQQAMGQSDLRHGREGAVGERPASEIGVHALRGGDNVGEHTIVFSTLGETLELTHRAQARDCYARGALAAAKFLADRPAGRYSMDDVLGWAGQ
jgi:4-hydroxy-tetrahydrodipicolinate reductase